MMARFVPVLCLAAVGFAGCAQLKPDAHINAAADLVNERTGHRPEWLEAWDASPPAWDAHSVLTCDQALVMALRNNRDLRADVEMIGQANADLVQAGLMQNPVINFMIMFPDGGGRSMLRGTGLPMQPLQDLWLIPARKEVAKAALQQAVVRVADRAVATAADVKRVYARLQYTQRAVELVRDNMHVVEQSTEIIRARQSAGQATQVDLNLARIRRLKLQSELIEMQAEHRRNQRELLMLMGVAGAADGWQVSPVAELSDPVNAIDDEGGLVTLAADQRLDVKAAQWQTEAAAANVKLMHREALPEMALGLSLERSPAPRSNNPKWAGQAGNIAARGLVDRAAGMQSGPMLPAPFSPKVREVEYTIGPMLELELPLFDQGQGRIGKAYYEYRQRFAEYEAKLQETIRMVREGLIMYGEAREQLDFYRTAIMPEVERNLALAQQSFVAGRESLTNLLETQEELIMTRLKMLAFYRDCCVQRAELERQVGGKLGTLSSPATTQPATQP